MSIRQDQENYALEARIKMARAFTGNLPDGITWKLTRRHGGKPDHSHIELWAGEEQVGYVKLEKTGRTYYGGNYSPDTYALHSPRIPNRGYRQFGTRRFKKVESLITAIGNFCRPTSDAEAIRKQANKDLSNIKARMQYKERDLWVYSDDDNVRRANNLQASRLASEQVEGFELSCEMIARRKVLLTYRERCQKWILKPLVDLSRTE